MKLSQDVHVDRISRKLVHLGLYGALCTSFFRATQSLKKSVGFAGLYGLFDEYHQTFTPLRSGMKFDVLIDLTGAIIAAILIWKFYAKLPPKLKSWLKP
jgi:VanZ family protein